MELFTVDRGNTLSPGMKCDLVVYDDINPEALREIVREMFPQGVSRHGELYFLRDSATTNVIDANTEMVFELVRRNRYQNRPSRFESLYACDSKEQARCFMRKVGAESAQVLRLESDHAFRADMNLLDSRMSALVKIYFANLYWQGRPHPETPPFWEWLVPCPVIICDRVAC